ncbi:MAG: PRELI domain containing protein 3A [Bathelium mastoideum]|nr:MAG: PRELI domain containing protein 3A [Bathelium mastoideum]
MKIFESSYDFDYSWDEVSTANWRKYCPWNDKSTHVLAVDTLSRRLDPKTGILRTERLITCKQSAPKWVQPFLGNSEYSHVYETSYVNPRAKKVTMCSTNMTWSDLLNVRETVVYRPVPSSPNMAEKTRFEQHAQITALCGGWQKVRNGIEQFTLERFGQNANKGREGFEAVLQMSRKVFGEERERQRRQEEQAKL